MLVVVPAVARMLHPRVLPAIEAAGFEPDVCWLDDIFAYGRLMARLWPCDDDVCVVEHDVEVRAHTLAGFEACPALWCSAPYRVAGDLVDGIGCARFRYPRPVVSSRRVSWANVESLYVTALHRAELLPHRHAEVFHHHEY